MSREKVVVSFSGGKDSMLSLHRMIKKGYSVNEVHYYTYTPYFDCFCSRCFYESDAIKLTKGENKE